MDSQYHEVKIAGDGNCLFRAFSYAIFGTQDEHANIRRDVVNYMRHHLVELDLINCQPGDRALGYDSDDPMVNVTNYLNEMENGQLSPEGVLVPAWGDASICKALAKMFKINIIVQMADDPNNPFTQTFPGTDTSSTLSVQLTLRERHFTPRITRAHPMIVEHFSKLKSRQQAVRRQPFSSSENQIGQASAQRNVNSSLKTFANVAKPKPIQVQRIVPMDVQLQRKPKPIPAERIAPMEVQLRNAAAQLNHLKPTQAVPAPPSSIAMQAEPKKRKEPDDENSEANSNKKKRDRCSVHMCRNWAKMNIQMAEQNFAGCIRVKDGKNSSLMWQDLKVCNPHKELLICEWLTGQPRRQQHKGQVITVNCIDCQRPMSLTSVLCPQHMRHITSTQAIVVPCNIENRAKVQRKGTGSVNLPIIYLCGEDDCESRMVASQQRKQRMIESQKKYCEEKKEMVLKGKQKYREKHKEDVLERKKMYDKENKKDVLKYKRQYDKKNKEDVLKRKKNYDKENKEDVLKRKKSYDKKNKEDVLKRKRHYDKKNKEDVLKYKRQYDKKNKEDVLKYKRQYDKKNKEDVLKYKRQYDKKNKEDVLKRKRQYDKENREKVLEARKLSYWKNRNKAVSWMSQYYEKNREKILESRKYHYRKRLVLNIKKKYVRQAHQKQLASIQNDSSVTSLSGPLLHYIKYQLPLLKESQTIDAQTTPMAREEMRAKISAQKTKMGKRKMKAQYASITEIKKWLEIEIAEQRMASSPGTSKQLDQIKATTAQAEAEGIVKNIFNNGEKLVTNKMRSRLKKVNQKAKDLEEHLKTCESASERMELLTATYGGDHDDKPMNQRMTLEKIVQRRHCEEIRYDDEEKRKMTCGPCIRCLPHNWQMRLHTVLLSLNEEISNEEMSQLLFKVETCEECLPGYCSLGENCNGFSILLYELSHHYENARALHKEYLRIKSLNEWRQKFWQAVYTVDVIQLQRLTSEEYIAQFVGCVDIGAEHEAVTHVNRSNVTDEQLQTQYADEFAQFQHDIYDIETEECDVCHMLKKPSDTWIVNVKPAVITGRNQRQCVAQNVKITLNIANNPKANKQKRSTDEKISPEFWDRMSRENQLTSTNMTMCDTCKHDIVHERVPLFSRSNNIAIDEEFPIKDLTVFERMLTSPEMVFQTIIKLPTLMRKLPHRMKTSAVRGTAIYLPMPLNATYKKLRNDFCGAMRIIIQRMPAEQKRELLREMVNLERVKNVVATFKSLGNPHFEDLEIPDNVEEQLDLAVTMEDDEEDDEEQECAQTVKKPKEAMLTQTIPAEYDHLTVKNTYNLKENEKDIVLYQQKRVESKPLYPNEVRDTAAFPYLFPTGRFGYNAVRERFVTEDQYVKHKLHQKRADFRRDLPFIFYQLSQKDNRSIKHGMYAVLKTGGQQMSKQQLMRGVDNNDPNIENRLNMLMQQLVGSPQYWRRRREDLNAMDEQHGPATFFMTLSCAEYRWPDMAAALKAYNENWRNKSDAAVGMQANEDPFTVMLQFYRRFYALWNIITAPNGGPLGVVEHFFWRVEMQRRGAPHVHCKIWVKGAPVIGVNSDEEIKAFIKQHVTCALPDEKTSPLLHKLVTTYQMHKTCTGSCSRRKKVKKKFYTFCRYGFPRKEAMDILLNDIDKVVRNRKAGISREKLYRLPRLSTEIRVNDYNAAILLFWQGNTDIQFVGEHTQTVNFYMTSYTTKSEDANTVAAWESAKRAYGSKTSQLYSMGRALLRKRELGGPEACIRLDSQHMYGSDSSVVYVSTNTKDRRHRRLKDMKTMKEEGDNASPFFDNMVDTYYINRNRQLEDVCLYDMVMNYKFTGDQNGKLKQIGGPKGSMVRRTKPVVVKTPRHTLKETTKEDYYHQLLMLFVPYRQEEELLGTYSSFEEAFNAREAEMNATMQKFRRGKAVMNAIEENKLRLAAEETAEKNDNQGNEDAYDDEEVVAEDLAYNVEEVVTNEKLTTMTDTLTADQRIVFNTVTSAIQRSESDPTKALRLFVSGSAGTGKSYLIDCIRQWAIITYGSSSVCLCAPTGMASYNIKGVTVHRLFNLPVQRGGVAKYEQLSDNALKTKRSELGKVRLLIVDEVSMISNVTLAMIDQRLCELFPSDTASFGGWNILLLGDLLQLPPVGAGSRGTCGFVFDELNSKHQNAFEGCGLMPLGLWSEFEYVELQINKRQENDSSWADMLNRLRLGRQTEDDITVLKTRLLRPVAEDEDVMSRLEICVRRFAEQLRSGQPAVCLFPTLTPAEEFNAMMLEEEKVETVDIPARDKFPQQTRSKKSKFKKFNKKESRQAAESAGLETNLKVGPGARVMLRRNLNVNEGQVNGALGTVTRILFNTQHRVETIVVTYDNNRDVEVPIKRVSSDYEVAKGRFATREQFPLILAYGITIHKCQGLSVNIAFVDIGDAVFESAQTYVALSRVREMAGLHIVNFNDRKIMCSREVLAEYIRLRLMALNKDNLKPLPQKIGKPSVALRRDEPAAPAEASTRKSTQQLPSAAISLAETETASKTTKQTPSAKSRPAETSTTATEGTRKSSRVRKRELSGGKATASRCQQVDTFGSPTRDPTTIDPQSVFICDGDGNCMFRAISHQLFQDESQHKILRAMAVEHLLRNPALFAGTFEAHTPQPGCSQPTWDQLEQLHLFCAKMSIDGFWGEYRCLVALCAELAVNIIVHTVDSSNNVVAAPYLICHGDENNNNQNVHLRFKQSGENAHYDSITNPKMFTAYGETLRCGNQATGKDVENDYKAVAPTVNFLLRLRSANKPTTSAVKLLLRLESNPKSPAQRATAIWTPLLPQDAPRTAISKHNTDLPNVIKDTPRTEPQTFVRKIAKKIRQSLLVVKKSFKNTEASPCDRDLSEQIRLQRKDAHRAWKTAGAGKKERQRAGRNPHWLEHFADIERQQEVRCLRSRSDSPAMHATESDAPLVLRLRSNHTNAARMTGVRTPLLIRPKTNKEARYDAERAWRAAELEEEIRKIQQTDTDPRMTGVRTPLLIRPNRQSGHTSTNGNRRANRSQQQNSSTRPVTATSNKPKTNKEACYDAERKRRAAELEEEIREKHQREKAQEEEREASRRKEDEDKKYMEEQEEQQRERQEREERLYRCEMEQRMQEEEEREVERERERKHYIEVQEQARRDERERQEREDREREEAGQRYEEEERQRYEEELRRYVEERQRYEEERRQREDREREEQRERERKHYLEVQEQARRDERERQERDDRERREQEERERIEREDRERIEREERERRDEESKRSRRNSGKRSSGR